MRTRAEDVAQGRRILSPLFRIPFRSIGSRLDDASAIVIIVGAYAFFLVMLLGS